MTITFDNDTDVIDYALEKIVSFARENQYLFVANCVWWIAGIIGLDNRLINHIDNLVLKTPNDIGEISPTPQDIARAISTERILSSDREEAPVISRRQLKKARKRLTKAQKLRQQGQSKVTKRK